MSQLFQMYPQGFIAVGKAERQNLSVGPVVTVLRAMLARRNLGAFRRLFINVPLSVS
jgi:hypothetical protein